MIKPILSLLAVALMATACVYPKTSGKSITKEFGISSTYRSLTASSAISVEYSPEATSLQITADSLTIPHIIVESDKDNINISMQSGKYSGIVKAIVPASDSLRSIQIHGASRFISHTRISSENLHVEVSGASQFNADIHCSNLHAYVNGASAALLDGYAGNAEIKVIGASALKPLSGEGLETKTAKVDISGASKAEIKCTGSVSGSVSGASKLTYTGGAECHVSESGSSKVSAR